MQLREEERPWDISWFEERKKEENNIKDRKETRTSAFVLLLCGKGSVHAVNIQKAEFRTAGQDASLRLMCA